MNMTIEKLAEIVNQQWNFGTPFRRTAKEWQAFCESTAQAIATAVLGPVTDEELRKAYAALASANRRTIPAGVTVMNAMEEPDWKPWKKHAESCLTAALPHLQRGVK